MNPAPQPRPRPAPLSPEAGLVGTILLHGRIPPEARALAPEDFLDPRFRLIWPVLLEVPEPSPHLVVAALQAQGQLEQAGGVSFLASLTDEPPLPSHLPAIITQIRRDAALRRAEAEARALVTALQRRDSTRAREAVSRIQTALAGDGGTMGAGRPQLVSAGQLSEIVFPEATWIIPGLVPVGLSILAGRPKIGKSWLALGLATAVAAGEGVLGRNEPMIEPGTVLFLALEDRLKRIRSRLSLMLRGRRPPDSLLIAEEWGRLNRGGTDLIRDFLSERPDCRLIVVDNYSRVRPPRSRDADEYQHETLFAGGLQTLANEMQIGVIVVHHTRKADSRDAVDQILGSTGLAGTADALLILRRGRGQADATLLVTGRDVQETELALRFAPQSGTWHLLGPAANFSLSQERTEILELLRTKGPCTPREIAESLGKKTSNIKALLWKMARDGEVRCLGGKYETI